MRRKLIRQGKGGCTVYLPKRWVEAKGLHPGDEVDLSEEGERICIAAEAVESAPKTVEKDITGLDKDSLQKTLTALYETGFDEMRLVFKHDRSSDARTGEKLRLTEQVVKTVSRLQGLAVVSQGEDFYIIKDITQQSGKEFDVILRRTFYLILELDNYVRENIASGEKRFRQGEERYHNIVSFVRFCLRLLNKKQVPQAQMYNYYEVVNSLQQIALYYRYLCEELEGAEVTDKTSDIINRIGDTVRLFYEFCYKVDNDKLKKLSQTIADLENEFEKLDTRHKEFMVLYHFSTVLDVIDADLKCLISLKALQGG